MAIFKCKMCGGDIELAADKTFGTCEYCGSTMTFPKLDDDQRAAAFNRGNHFRRIGEFDKALAVYERIVREDDTDAEAHWCCALCRFGIEYVEDPATFEYLPTCHRASFDSFLEDVDYLAAVEHSEGITKRQYQKDGAKIAEVQRGILATSQNEEPFDVFICYKESDENGERTRDSLMAQDVYYQLADQGYRVFFSRITLEDMAGKEYEPYIFAALNSAKVMIVIGTKPEYMNAVWVKNEWSRFLAMMKKDRHKLLLPCYRDMDPYDMPEQLSVLQSYDMSKIGFIQDLTRGIKKVLDAEKKPEPVKETVVVQQTGNANTTALLKRGQMALEDGEWDKADSFFEEVLNQDAECVKAYLGKLMAELHVKKQEELKNQAEPFDGSNNYQKAIRFADDKLRATLIGYIEHINTRNENARLEKLYAAALAKMECALTEEEFKSAAYCFNDITQYKDSAILREDCLQKAKTARKDAILAKGKSEMIGSDISNYESAIELFKTIPGWKDADEEITVCQQLIEKLKAKAEAERLEQERKTELARKAAEQRAKRIKKIAVITTPIACAVIVFIIILTNVIIPNIKYNKATALMDDGKYAKAFSLFKTIDTLKDSKDKAMECQYQNALLLLDQGNELEAYEAFESLSAQNYKDSREQAKAHRFQWEQAKFKTVKPGEYVRFGVYEQDNDTATGKELIEWLVLKVDDGKALVVSKYGLDCKEYNEKFVPVDWEACTLRAWLNGDFINTAFSAEEKAMISTVTVPAIKERGETAKIGNDTQDQVFLLHYSELDGDINFKSCEPTKYAAANGAFVGGSGKCRWWLRESAITALVDAVNQDYIDSVAANNTKVCVRPAMWIDLNKE